MFGNKKKKSVRVPIEEYEQMRDTLLNWEWMTEAFDSEKNKSVYKPTELGVAAYSAIVQLVGKESLVNGYKLDVKKMEGITLNGQQVKQEVIEKLLGGGIITQTYDPVLDINKYELTPQGAKLFVAFFVSNNRVVGTLPGDKTAAFFKIMENMPRYVNTASALIAQLGNAFQSFDSQGASVSQPQQSAPRYKKSKSKGPYTKKQKQAYAKKKAQWKKENAKKYKSNSGSNKQYKEPQNEWSKAGDDMMKGMKF